MKIVNQLVNPTVLFSALKPNDVFMTLDGEGDVYIKIGTDSIDRWATIDFNSYCFTQQKLQKLNEGVEVVPVESELKLLKNDYEKYKSRI